MITYAMASDLGAAEDVLVAMLQDGAVPSTNALLVLFGAYGRCGDEARAEQCLLLMREAGVSCDPSYEAPLVNEYRRMELIRLQENGVLCALHVREYKWGRGPDAVVDTTVPVPVPVLVMPDGSVRCIGEAGRVRGGGGAAGQDPTPREGGKSPPSTDPKMVVRVNGFCGYWRRRRFCFRHTTRGIFFTLCTFSQNTQNFVENSKMGEKQHFDPNPTSGDLG